MLLTKKYLADRLFSHEKSSRTQLCKKNQFIKQGTLDFFLTKMCCFGREKKSAKLRNLHHDKTIKYNFFMQSFLKMASLGTILKVVHTSHIYIFVIKTVFAA